MKSIIMYALPKDYTPRDKYRIAARLGLEPVLGTITGVLFPTDQGHLYTMKREITSAEQACPLSYISFLTMATEFNNALPRTKWQSGHPPCVGEWNASAYRRNEKSKRWFDGQNWSVAYEDIDSDEVKRVARTQITTWHHSQIQWRGLAEQPITAGFAK